MIYCFRCHRPIKYPTVIDGHPYGKSCAEKAPIKLFGCDIMSSEDLKIEDLEVRHFMLGVKKLQRRAIMDGLSGCEFFREFLRGYTVEYNAFNRKYKLIRKKDNKILVQWSG